MTMTLFWYTKHLIDLFENEGKVIEISNPICLPEYEYELKRRSLNYQVVDKTIEVLIRPSRKGES